MEIESAKLNVEVRYSAFDADSERVLVKRFRSHGKPHYRVRIFLDGDDISKVEKVIYTLHPSFPSPRRKVSTKPRFELVIWTWGIFQIGVEIVDNQGRIDTRTINLNYSADIQKAKANNLLYWAD